MLISVAIYSKIIVALSLLVPCPQFILDFSIEYWDLKNSEIERLANSNSEMLKQLDDLHKNNVHYTVYNDIKSDINVISDTNRKLAIQNAELSESVKNYKTTTQLDK